MSFKQKGNNSCQTQCWWSLQSFVYNWFISTFSSMPSLLFSYSPSYFSLEDILLQDVRVSCKFEVAVPKLGTISYLLYPFLILILCVNLYRNAGSVSWLWRPKARLQSWAAILDGTNSLLQKSGNFWSAPILQSKLQVKSLSCVQKYFLILINSFRQILKADSFVVDLHKWGPYFYDLGLHVANLGLKDSLDIKRCLIDVIQFNL